MQGGGIKKHRDRVHIGCSSPGPLAVIGLRTCAISMEEV